MERFVPCDKLDKAITFVKETYLGAEMQIILTTEIIRARTLALRAVADDKALEALRNEINALDSNDPRAWAWEILNIYTKAVAKADEEWALVLADE